MESVKVSKASLQEKVRKNREAHHAQWLKAFEGYQGACTRALEQNLAAVKAGSRERVYINEEPPADHTRDYDCALAMLDMSVDTEVTISEEAFKQYVMDDWKWKHAWNVSNSKYLASDIQNLHNR